MGNQSDDTTTSATSTENENDSNFHYVSSISSCTAPSKASSSSLEQHHHHHHHHHTKKQSVLEEPTWREMTSSSGGSSEEEGECQRPAVMTTSNHNHSNELPFRRQGSAMTPPVRVETDDELDDDDDDQLRQDDDDDEEELQVDDKPDYYHHHSEEDNSRSNSNHRILKPPVRTKTQEDTALVPQQQQHRGGAVDGDEALEEHPQPHPQPQPVRGVSPPVSNSSTNQDQSQQQHQEEEEPTPQHLPPLPPSSSHRTTGPTPQPSATVGAVSYSISEDLTPRQSNAKSWGAAAQGPGGLAAQLLSHTARPPMVLPFSPIMPQRRASIVRNHNDEKDEDDQENHDNNDDNNNDDDHTNLDHSEPSELSSEAITPPSHRFQTTASTMPRDQPMRLPKAGWSIASGEDISIDTYSDTSSSSSSSSSSDDDDQEYREHYHPKHDDEHYEFDDDTITTAMTDPHLQRKQRRPSEQRRWMEQQAYTYDDDDDEDDDDDDDEEEEDENNHDENEDYNDDQWKDQQDPRRRQLQPQQAYNLDAPGAHAMEPTASHPALHKADPYHDSITRTAITNQDAYLVSATLVEELSSRDMANKQGAERFQILEARQRRLEEQIAAQVAVIKSHADELARLRNHRQQQNSSLAKVATTTATTTTTTTTTATTAAATKAQVVMEEKDSSEVDREIREREANLQERELELDRLMKNRRGIHKGMKKVLKRLKKSRFARKNPSTASTNSKRSNITTTTNTTTRDVVASIAEEVSDDDEGSSGEFAGDHHPAEEHPQQQQQQQHLQSSSRPEPTRELKKKRSDRFIPPQKSPFDGQSISQLKELAQKHQVDLSGCVERSQIVQQLKDAGVASPKPNNSFSNSRPFKIFTSKVNRSVKNKNDTSSHSKHSKNHETSSPEAVVEGKKRPDQFIQPKKCPFDGYKIARLKVIADETNVDLSSCIERSQIVQQLLDAGVTPKKHSAFSMPFGGNRRGAYNHSSDHERGSNSLSGIRKGDSTRNSISHHERRTSSPPLGVTSTHKRTATYTQPAKDAFDGYSISQLKTIANETSLDISSCIERRQIVAALLHHGVRPRSNMNRSSHNPAPAPPPPKKKPSDPPPFHGYAVARLKAIAKETNVDISSCIERQQIVNTLLRHGVRPRKTTTPSSSPSSMHSNKTASMPSSHKNHHPLEKHSISELKALAKEHRVDVSACVEREEIVQMLEEARVVPPRRR